MLIEEVVAFGIFGMLTSAMMGLVITEGKRPMLTLFLLLEGMFVGWISGVIWVYLTGGLEVSAVALIIPVFISAFFSLLTIVYMPKNFWNRERFKKVSPIATVLSVLVLVGAIFMVFYSTLPTAYASVYSTETFFMEDVEWQPDAIIMRDTHIELFSATPTYSLPIQIETAKSSIQAFRMMEEPEEGGYMDFQVTMGVDEGIWSKPYIKIVVFEDKDEDETLSAGDILWADTNYKIVTAVGNWRANCVWENGQPVASAFATETAILPIFHADTMTEWMDEEGQRFQNTPETFIPTHDMFSWEQTDNKIESKEQVISYASITEGEATSIRGRLYCHGASIGKHCILIRAYDAIITDPSEEEVDPIASKVIPFNIAGKQGGFGQEWTILLGLGCLVGVGIVVQRRKEWF